MSALLFALPLLLGTSLSTDAAKAAVKSYLAENLDDPAFDEVRWWESNHLDGSFFRERGDVTWPFWLAVKEKGTAIRFKFREKNGGAKVIRDETFFIDEEGAVWKRVPAIDYRLPGESIEKWQKRFNIKPTAP